MSRENEEQLSYRAREVMRNGGTVAFPTDTLYGLGVNAELRQAVEVLYSLKGREPGKPISVMVPDIDGLGRLGVIDRRLREVLAGILPGAFTVIVRSSGKLPHISRGGKIGIRIPDHGFSRKLCSEFPVTATSANLSGMPSPGSASEVSLRVDLLLDGGPTRRGIQSTVVDFTGDRPLVLREGSGDIDLMNRMLGRSGLPSAVLARQDVGKDGG